MATGQRRSGTVHATLGKALKTAKIQRRPWKQELSRFLLHYTEHRRIAQREYHRQNVYLTELFKDNYLSVLNKKDNLNRHKEAQNNERKRKEYNEKYDARKHKSKKSEVDVGDHVLVRQERKNKLTSTFKPIPYVVTKHEHSRVTARNHNGHVITRNVSYFKRIPKLMNTDTDIDDKINLDRPDNVIERGNATNNATQAEVLNEPYKGLFIWRRVTRQGKLLVMQRRDPGYYRN
jgi:hypothetical protein